jgi:hypothetical protein
MSHTRSGNRLSSLVRHRRSSLPIKEGQSSPAQCCLGGAGVRDGKRQTRRRRMAAPITALQGWSDQCFQAPIGFRRRDAEQACGDLDQRWFRGVWLRGGRSQQCFLVANDDCNDDRTQKPLPPAGRLTIQFLTSEANQATRRRPSRRCLGNAPTAM